MSERDERDRRATDLVARKADMLAELLLAVDRRRSRRQRRRVALGVVAIVLLAWSMQQAWRPDSGAWRTDETISRHATARGPASPAERERTQPPHHRVVRDDATIVRRLAAPVDRALAITIVRDHDVDADLVLDDRELLDWLRRAGRPSGFVRTADHFQLTPIAQGD